MKIALPEPAAGASALLGAALVALGAWLLVPRRAAGDASRPAIRVCLVDVSASAIERRSGSRAWIDAALAEERDAAEAAGEDLETVLFGSDVRRIEGPIGEIAPEPATRLAGALEVARGLALDPDRKGARIVVLGDRTYTGADPSPRIRELRRDGIGIRWVDAPPPDRRELLAGALALPSEVEAGAPIAVEADLFLAPGPGGIPERVTVRIEKDSETRAVEVEVPKELPLDPDGYLRWRLRCDAGSAAPGLNRIRIGESEGFVRGAGRLAIGVVGSGIGAAPGLDLAPTASEDLAARLPVLDAVVSGELPPEILRFLRSFVERGGGWLCCGGLGEDDPLLPLRPPDEARDPRDVVVLVDRSGSMSGAPFESVRRATLRLVDAAGERDEVALRFFGDRLFEATTIKSAGDDRERDRILREAGERFLASGSTGGSTAIARSLEAFAETRERAGREALAFLLSDGVDTVDPDAAERCARVLPRLLAAKCRLVVIAAGDAPDLAVLKTLVAAGESLREVGPLAGASESLADVFRREIAREGFREGEGLRVLPAPRAEGSLAADVLEGFGSADPAAWPTIRRYARAELAPGAEAVLVSERGEPLLAIHRVGQGLVAACAFEPGEDWTPLLTPLLRALARGDRGDPSGGDRGSAARARLHGGELAIENLPAGAPAELEAHVFGADAAEPILVLPLSPPLEGADPRRTRVATWPGLDLELRIARVEVRARGGVDGGFAPLDLALAGPRSPESVLPRPRVDPGAIEGRAADASGRRASGPRPHPAARWVLFSGLLLLTISGLSGFFERRSR